MEGLAIFLILAVLTGVLIVMAMLRDNDRRGGQQQGRGSNIPEPGNSEPLDPFLNEIYIRHPVRSVAHKTDNAVREAGPHILRLAREHNETPLLVAYAAGRDVVVVTNGRTMVVQGASVQTMIPHHPGTRTSIPKASGSGVEVAVRGQKTQTRFPVQTLQVARLVCSVIDQWVDNPEVRHDPRVVITSRRVVLPDEFFADTLREAGFPVTAFNMRSIYERFGMMFIGKARQYIDGKYGQATGERFTEQYGRPSDDLLPTWPATILRGWIELEPDLAPLVACMPVYWRHFLIETKNDGGYMSNPHQTLSMWMNEWYEDNGRGPLRNPEPGTPTVA
ncbi:MAG: hypothetical protein ACRDQ5_03735 [Sciscionella sp.]